VPLEDPVSSHEEPGAHPEEPAEFHVEPSRVAEERVRLGVEPAASPADGAMFHVEPVGSGEEPAGSTEEPASADAEPSTARAGTAFHVEPPALGAGTAMFHVEPSTSGAGTVMSHAEPPASSEKEAELAAAGLFGDRLALARRYADHLVTTGVERGLIGPREAPRIWGRHLLNCAVVAELLPDGARVVDLGSGAGLPGIPFVLTRPDVSVVLVEPLARRVDWLREVVEDLGLPVEIERGRAEEPAVRARWEGADVVTARAVAPLARLAGWALPLLRTGGALLALKGASATDEAARDATAVRRLGGTDPRVVRCGVGVVDPPSTVVVVERSRGTGRRPARRPRRREERT
jgi:16S rRNA (guanine527-N7)-methyltransferase